MQFSERVAEKREQIVSYVMCRLRVSRDKAEDIVQDVLANALNKQEQFEGGEYEAALVRWLETSAFRRGLRVVDPIRRFVDAGSNNHTDSAGTPSSDLRLNEAKARIYDAIAGLSETQRTVITWHFFQGMSVKDIACELGKHQGSISRIKAKAMEKLATLLDPDDFQTMLR